MKAIVEQALKRWGMAGAAWTFIAGRENQVFRVEAECGLFALRVKRPGYRRVEELVSELQWLNAMHGAGLNVPRPVPSADGKLLEEIETYRVDMVGWLDGKPLGKSRVPLELEDRIGTFCGIGAEMARLHTACDRWQRPPGFTRHAWDADGLLGEEPVWGRFWENPTLPEQIRALFNRFREHARHLLTAHADTLDYGLVHADFVRENILLDEGRIAIIDFDDGGFGYRQFDLATVLLKNRSEPDYPDLKQALIDGYLSQRPLDLETLDLFVVLRAMTYVGWIITRMQEPGGAERNIRFTTEAEALRATFLRSQQPE